MMIEIIELRKKLRKLRKVHLVLCLLGLGISAYTVHVEFNLEKDPSYQALCDISPKISCTAVFGSEWGKGFGFLGKIFGDKSALNQPNGVFGVISYPLFALFSRFDNMLMAKVTLFIGIAGVVLSAYLGYILNYVLEDLCVVCVTIYLLNFFLLITSSLQFRSLRSLLKLQSVNSSPPKAEMVKKRV